MYDLRGIFRELCMDCGEEECSEFEKVKVSPFCGYCGCPATKHKKRKITEDNNNFSTNDDGTTFSLEFLNVESETERKDNFTVNEVSSIIHPIQTIASKGLESLVPDLPVFSLSLKSVLENGNLEESKMWDSLIMQTSAHYLDCPYMKTSTAYGIVVYPCIEAGGKKPWSKFTKALSQKIRKDRCLRRALNLMEKKDSQTLQPMNFAEKQLAPHFTTGQLTRPILSRTETSLPEKSPSEIIEMQKKLSIEWKKTKPEKTLLKFYLRETFSDRTALLKQEASFDKILTLYPCFSSAYYFIVEFSLMVGSKTMRKFNLKLKEFFLKVKDKLDIANKYDDTLLSAWLTFEKEVSIHQIKTLRYQPIMEVTDNHDDYEMKLKNIPDTQAPKAILRIKNKKISDAAVITCGHFINETPKGVMGILTLLICMYYTLELNYPLPYVQAMGAVGAFLLDHHYYNLGKRAKDVLSKLM